MGLLIIDMLVRYWPSLNLRGVSAPAIGSMCHAYMYAMMMPQQVAINGHGHAAEVLARPLRWCLSGALSVVVSSQTNILIRYKRLSKVPSKLFRCILCATNPAYP